MHALQKGHDRIGYIKSIFSNIEKMLTGLTNRFSGVLIRHLGGMGGLGIALRGASFTTASGKDVSCN